MRTGFATPIIPGRGTTTRGARLAFAAALLAACAGPAASEPSESASAAESTAASTRTAGATSQAAAYLCDTLLEPREPSPAPGSTMEVGFVTEDMGSLHTDSTSTTLAYGHCPPTSGIHFYSPGPLLSNFYGPEREEHPGRWVHNLEHGYVVLLYSCADACPSAAEIGELRRFVEETETERAAVCGVRGKLVATRFDEMATRFALVAWNRAHLSATFDADLASAFAEKYAGRPFASPEWDAC